MKISSNLDEREFRRAIESQVQAGAGELAADWSRQLENLRAQLAGHPVEEIKPHLQALFRRGGGTISDPELTDWAQLISDNTRITFEPEKIRW
ncbi:hypothetical protein FBY40_0236 [Microbacterium sp. SLBN-154]|uniref:hypothetical protein n=1 Tax=Microbacterium sp. SLBN-154 TaxID=2768458 RepID=UPI00114EA416|nr:hypothetical protein [Microbacterium sp. SLBN-154]TQK17759.1 hypothetical protein FBY40_0236 [Microbacterium sp. SLBN-154]